MSDAAFPGGETITVTVPCSTGVGHATSHTVAIGPAKRRNTKWTVETGHDLKAERIALALGGARLSCLDLIDSEVPSIQRLYESLHRDPIVRIKPLRGGRWALTKPTEGCECSSRTWPQPEDAVNHYRQLSHWCVVSHAPYVPTRELLGMLMESTGTAAWAASWTMNLPTRAVERVDDLFELWKAGIHPDQVNRIHSGLGLPEPLNLSAYVHIARKRIDLSWLSRFADSPAAVGWAARTYTTWDASHPDARSEWYQAGVNLQSIGMLLDSPYSLEDVRSLAVTTDGSLNEAGATLSGWIAANCRPPIAEVIRVCRLVPHGRQSPALAAVEAVLRRTDGHRGGMSRTQVGLVLVAAGTPTTAAVLINGGVRDLDDFEMWETGRKGL